MRIVGKLRFTDLSFENDPMGQKVCEISRFKTAFEATAQQKDH
jgi:hypothetical protein|tara:strand:+ start:276 stop:404 length:129 start_codon:yes stop_codon:yes gene_type:complete